MATETAGGSAQDLNLASGTFLNGLSGCTVVLWIKSDATSTDKGMLFTNASPPNGTDQAIGCRYDAAGASYGGTSVIKLSIDAGTKTNSGYESASTVQTTALQCLIFSWASGGQEELWIDGVLDTPTGRAAAYSGTTVNCNNFLMHRGGKDGSNAWDGIIYEMRIYNRKLTVNEVDWINAAKGQDAIRNGMLIKWHGDQSYPAQSATAITDRSGNGRDGTNNGTVTYAEDVIHTRRRRAA